MHVAPESSAMPTPLFKGVAPSLTILKSESANIDSSELKSFGKEVAGAADYGLKWELELRKNLIPKKSLISQPINISGRLKHGRNEHSGTVGALSGE
jgi:hypothetical protein